MKPVEGPLLLFTLMLSAVTLSGCGDKNEREFIPGMQIRRRYYRRLRMYPG